MPGRVRPRRDHERLHQLVRDGLSVEEAGKKVGISKQAAYRWIKGLPSNMYEEPGQERKTRAHRAFQIPNPKAWEDLDPLGQEMLKSFSLFSEKALCRRVPPWRIRAAELSVEMILDKSERHYVIANMPPGVGKSTLWELDIPVWLLCGGGFLNPEVGRALRMMFGHAVAKKATHYVQRLARMLESNRPYYDKEQSRYAEVCLAQMYGRFKPMQALGDIEMWQHDQFVVAQLEDVDLSEKEPTVQAVSRASVFLGERGEYCAWDDLVTDKNSRTVEAQEDLAAFFEKEAEPRVEPGGIAWLTGQRMGPLDLFRNRLDVFYTDDDGIPKQKYVHIVWPAHNDRSCDADQGGSHRQWDLEEDGCLLDEHRLPWKEVLKVRGTVNYRTVYQQEDTNPEQALVLRVYLDGGSDIEGNEYPGCYDRDRGWFEHPERADGLVNYVTVDPSATGNWAIEWWACAGLDKPRYLIAGKRGQMQAGDLLDWDERIGFKGIMHEWQMASIAANQPIRVWVVEANAAQRYLFQFRHFERWHDQFRFVEVIQHQTQRNKLDQYMGVEGTLREVYRAGLKRLPRKQGDLDSLNFVRAMERELTTWRRGVSGGFDTVMADWFGETNLEKILFYGQRTLADFDVGAKLPPYLMRQRKEYLIR
jgi:transposase-like protein